MMKISYIYHCTINSSCPNNYPKLNKDKMECININIINMIEEIIENNKNKTKNM